MSVSSNDAASDAAPFSDVAVAVAMGDDTLARADAGDNAMPSFATMDWAEDARVKANVDTVERGGSVDHGDEFEDNTIAVNKGVAGSATGGLASQIKLSSTWLSSGDDSLSSQNDTSFGENKADHNASTSSSEIANANSNSNAAVQMMSSEDRLRKNMKTMAMALVLFAVIAISLGIALVVVSTSDKGTQEAATTNRSGETILETYEILPPLETDEAAVSDSETNPTINATLPAVQVDAGATAVTVKLSHYPTSAPSSADPTSHPSNSPTSQHPTETPSTVPSNAPSNSPIDPFYFGDLSVTNDELGIEMSAGLTVKLVATAGDKVNYGNGGESKEDYHELMDGAAIIPLKDTDGGYVYVSNAERSDGKGGVYGLYFDKYGNVTDYKALLEGTTDNCGGGLSPWNTWISCEEYDDGQCWQVDPDPSSPYHDSPKETTLGGKNGGTYESVAVDNRMQERPIFYVTEDLEDGALRRVEIMGTGWDSLHQEDTATTTFLRILGDSTFEWTADEKDARDSAEEYFPNSEGISFHEEEGKLYFMSKVDKSVIILDVDNLTYETEVTGKKFYGDGSFSEQPDQNIFGQSYRHMYFTEDGGSTPGVYARLGSTGVYYTMFQGTSKEYNDDETVGVALSPDGTKFYAGIQDAGVLFEFRREDGLPFE